MTQSEFTSKMLYAESMKNLSARQEYWAGYMRGLRRRFHGEKFGTAEEHTLWMSLIGDRDESRSERGRGYRDGFTEVAISQAICLRCGHEWFPKTSGAPAICPTCKSPYWNKPKK